MSSAVRPRGRYRRMRREGATTVEFAFAAIPMFLAVFASIEFGRGLMAVASLEEAARAGCRVATLEGATTTDVEQEIAGFLGSTNITSYVVTVQPGQPSGVNQWQPVTVTVVAGVDAMTWLPAPNFLANKSITATCTLAREGDDST